MDEAPETSRLEVVIVGNDQRTFYDVRDMCISLYGNDESLNNHVIVLASVNEPFQSFKQRYPGKKIICYQLEQLGNGSYYFDVTVKSGITAARTKHLTEWLKGSDQIWDYDLDNITFLQGLGYNVKFMPMKYYDGIQYPYYRPIQKDTDIFFFGTMNTRRMSYLRMLKPYRLMVVDHIHPMYGDELQQYIQRSKIILNLHYYNACLQEQVRLFRLLGNGCCILSERSRHNYFGDLVMEFGGNELIAKVDYLLKDDKWKEFSSTVAERFRNKVITPAVRKPLIIKPRMLSFRKA